MLQKNITDTFEYLSVYTIKGEKSLREGQFPSSQMFAILSPIVKKSGLDADDVRRYRPISNLTFMSKLIERMVYQQLTAYLEKHDMLSKHQSGFRAHHSTETAVLKVISDILGAADQGYVALLGLLDMSDAFDTVDHDILLERLATPFGMALAWLRSFLTGRSQRVSFNGGLSSIGLITTGVVPQGSVLGPLLFLLYSADVPLIASQHGLSIHCYADDGQIYIFVKAAAAVGMVNKVASCIELKRSTDEWPLKLNSKKTQFIWLGSRQQLSIEGRPRTRSTR